ncbi:MAG: hypothetical protein GC161_05510 [Planctomycetaceae bacterium]|nr:hypothetical protein [Planctomycetaceae bacterium]
MKRVLALIVALLVWCSPALPQELANLRIAVDAEPGTPRTEALVALLRTRFTRVDVGSVAEADVVVLDRWEGIGERRPDRSWRSDWPRPHKPHVVLGGAARGAIPAWNLLGTHAGKPVEGPTERRDPGSTRPGPELTEAVFADGYAPLAFALLEAPDAHVALATRDGIGRPLAVVWHQGGFVFFGPGAAANELSAEWKDVLLRCIAYAGGFWRSVGIFSPGAPGADARGEVAWRLSGKSPLVAGLAALVSDPHAPTSGDAGEWHDWFSRNGPYLVSDEQGRLQLDAGLLAFEAELSSPGFVASVVARLSAESAEERATARRLLERHVEGGPGVYASRAEWEAWIENERRTLVYVGSYQRWRRDWAQGSMSTLAAWDRAPMFRAGGRSFHAVDPRMEVHVPGSDGPPSLLRVPYIWSLPPEAAADALMRWLQQTEDVAERELVLRNMAELGPDASRVAGAVAEWFAGDSPELVVRVLAAGGPATFDSFLRAAKLGEEVARASVDPQVKPDRSVAAVVGMELVRFWERAHIDLDVPVEVLVRHPAADARFLGRVAAAAAGLAENRWPVLQEALLGGLARSGAPSDPSWVGPLTTLLEREGSLDTLNLVGALVQHGDKRWLEAVRRCVAASAAEDLELPAKEVAALARMGAPGVELFLELAPKGTRTWRANLAPHVELPLLAQHLSPPEWLASSADFELILRVLVRQSNVHPSWYEALHEVAAGDDDRTAVPALEAAGRVLSRQRSRPLLEAALVHPSHWRRRAAAHAIAAFHPGADYARAAMLAASKDEDPWVQATALWSLREPLGDHDAIVVARLREVAESGSPFAAVARHALYRRTVSDTPLLDAVHGLNETIATAPSDRLESNFPKERWSAALWAAKQGEQDEERRQRVEHELRGWVADLWENGIDWDARGESDATRLLVRLGEAGLLEIERSQPYVWSGNAYAFEGHGGVVRAMGSDGWPLLAGMLWGIQVALDTPVFDWPSVPDASAWLATMLAQRESHGIAIDAGFDFDLSTGRWKSLGEAGRAALRELERHPSAAVREHAHAVLGRLDG